MKKTSSGKKQNPPKRSKREVAIANLKKIHDAHRKVDWLRLEQYKVNRIAGMNRFQAALKAGYPYSRAKSQSYKIDRLANIGIKSALEDAGATNQIMARELVRLATAAMKRQKCTVEVRQEDDELIIDDHAAELVPDEHLRKESWELIGKLKKQLTPQPFIPDGNFRRLVIVIEKDQDASDEGRRDQDTVDQAPKLRVETVDE